MAHGSNDEIVPISVALKGADYLQKQGFEVNFISDPVGHKVGVEGMKALKIWIKEQLFPDLP